MRLRTLAWLALVVTACGGTVLDPEDGETAPSSQTGSGSGSETGSQTGSETAPDFKDVPLGECIEGFSRHVDATTPCNWLGEDGLCYETKEAACNCICPRDRDSTCSSGFFRGEGEATPVNCS
jgi:hypothetical protein